MEIKAETKPEVKTIKRSLSFNAESGKAVGYVAVYNSPSQVLTRSDGVPFIETILPGAFTATLADAHNIFALSSHNREDVLGSTQAGTLVIREDANGLYVEITLPDTGAGNDLKALLARNEPLGGSFCADVDSWQWSSNPQNGTMICELQALSLKEVTITAFPAYPDTSIVLRSNRHPAIVKTKETEKPNEVEAYKLRLRMLQL